MSNPNFDALLSTTLANYRDQLTDNVFTARPLTYFLSDKGRIRMLNGGTKIVEPLIYGQNSTVASYSGYDTISLTAQTGITAAEYDWKQYAASIAISGIEEAKNNGEQEIINLLEAKIMQAEESMREGLTRCSSLTALATAARTGTVWATSLKHRAPLVVSTVQPLATNTGVRMRKTPQVL